MTDTTELNDELRPEYDETLLKNGTRGKYAQQYAASTNTVRLAPDVAAAFPNEEAVNEALRFVIKIMDDAKHQGPPLRLMAGLGASTLLRQTPP